jgi:hypothetical protein
VFEVSGPEHDERVPVEIMNVTIMPNFRRVIRTILVSIQGYCKTYLSDLEHMKPFRISNFLTLVFVFVFSAAAQSTPRAVVESFYRFDGSHSQTFNRKNIDARRRWFTDVLYRQFENELKRQREYLRQNPTDKPHFGDGLPFRPLDETCQAGRVTYRYSVAVGRASTRAANATVPVTFSFPKSCDLPSPQYSVRLRRVNGVWRINDIEYPGGSTLLGDLMRMDY